MAERFLITETHGPYKKGTIHTPLEKNLRVWRGRDWAEPAKEKAETATKRAAENAAREPVDESKTQIHVEQNGSWYTIYRDGVVVDKVQGTAAMNEAVEALEGGEE